MQWVLEIEVQGRTLRWSTEPLEIDASHVCRGGLRGGLAVAEGSTVVRVMVIDPELAAVVGDLQGAPAVLRRWVEGDAYLDSVVVIAGEVIDPTWDDPSQPVEIGISSQTATILGSPLPDPLARVCEQTWPLGGGTAADTGIAYPVILGYPGFEGEGVDPYPIVPLALAQWSAVRASTYAPVCDDPAATITSVRVRNDAVGAEANQDVGRIDDLLGQRLLVADFGASATGYPASVVDARALFAGFSPTGGGGVARTAYDVIAYLLRRWGPGTCDWARMAELRDLLARYQVDSWIDQSIPDPWAWIAQVLVPDLPVAIRVSPSGLRYLVPTTYRIDPRRVVGELEVGRNAEIVARIALGPGPINEVVAEYREDRAGVYRARVVITGSTGADLGATPITAPGATSTQTVTVVRSGRCVASRARYGRRVAPEVHAVDWTWDESTVLRVLEDRIEREALPAWITSYRIDRRARFDLSEGDVIRVVDEWRNLDELAVISAPPIVGATGTTVEVWIPR